MKPTLKLAPKKPRTGPSMALLRRAVRLYRGGYADRSIRKANMRAWLASVQSLGDAWLLAKPQAKVKRSGT